MHNYARLSLLIRLAKHRQTEAARRLGECQRERQSQLARLHDLEQYRGEYQDGFQQQASGGLRASDLLTYRQFLVRLDEAIVQQGHTLTRAERDLEQARKHWHAQHNRVASLERLAAKSQALARIATERREQKESDERSCQAVARRLSVR